MAALPGGGARLQLDRAAALLQRRRCRLQNPHDPQANFPVRQRRRVLDHAVHEVLRLDRLVTLPGMAPPMAGVVEVRGVPLPVMDLRPSADTPGDVLVLAADGNDSTSLGVAVDGVTAQGGVDAVAFGESGHELNGYERRSRYSADTAPFVRVVSR